MSHRLVGEKFGKAGKATLGINVERGGIDITLPPYRGKKNPGDLWKEDGGVVE